MPDRNAQTHAPRSVANSAAVSPDSSPAAAAPWLNKKLVLIVVLGAVLVGVLIRNAHLPDESTSAEETAAMEVQPAPATAISTPPAARPRAPLPPIRLATLVLQNPFRSPLFAGPATVPVSLARSENPETAGGAAVETAPGSLPTLKVSAILERRGERVALIGKQIVREGDRLGAGLQVIAIRSDEVVIGRPISDPAPPPPAEVNPAN